jgi:hypothetical protein
MKIEVIHRRDKMKKTLFFTVTVFLIASLLTGCFGGGYKSLDSKVEGEITIMLWSGDGTLMEDNWKKNSCP